MPRPHFFRKSATLLLASQTANTFLPTLSPQRSFLMILRLLSTIVYLAHNRNALPAVLPATSLAYNPNTEPKSNDWSKEAVLTLVGVLAAVACFIIGLAWPRLRTWLCNLPKCQLAFSTSVLKLQPNFCHRRCFWNPLKLQGPAATQGNNARHGRNTTAVTGRVPRMARVQ
jgi:hypothetical protein